jgi:hypothetical protein
MEKKRRSQFNRRKAEKQVEQALRDMLKENGLIQSLPEITKRAKEAQSPKAPPGEGMNIAVSLFFGSQLRQAFAGKVKNEEQLQNALGTIRDVGEKTPTAIRRAMKVLGQALPRRGGPGRQPKLNAMQAVQVCDQIALFLRRGHTLKDALQKLAQLTPTLLGKKVGSRTLQKAWDKRREYRSE